MLVQKIAINSIFSQRVDTPLPTVHGTQPDLPPRVEELSPLVLNVTYGIIIRLVLPLVPILGQYHLQILLPGGRGTEFDPYSDGTIGVFQDLTARVDW